MEYEIKRILLKDDLSKLKELLNSTNMDVYIDSIGEFVLAVKVKNYSKELFILNKPSTLPDEDDYPKIEISELPYSTEIKWRRVVSNQKLEAIKLLRDSISWKNRDNSWKVQADVAIKLIFRNQEILVIVVDSIGGLMKCVQSKGKLISNVMPLGEYWSMKTDKLIDAERIEIDLYGI